MCFTGQNEKEQRKASSTSQVRASSWLVHNKGTGNTQTSRWIFGHILGEQFLMIGHPWMLRPPEVTTPHQDHAHLEARRAFLDWWILNDSDCDIISTAECHFLLTWTTRSDHQRAPCSLYVNLALLQHLEAAPYLASNYTSLSLAALYLLLLLLFQWLLSFQLLAVSFWLLKLPPPPP